MTAPSKKAGAHLSLVKGEGEVSSDSSLLAAFARGDAQALGTFFERHRTAVYRVGLRYCANRDDALELTQKTFLHALTAARRKLPVEATGPNAVPLRAWLLRIAVNLAKNFVRDSGKRPTATLDVLEFQPATGDSPEAQASRAQLHKVTRAAAAALSPRQKEVFALRVDADLSFADIASALGITEANAKVHFHYALKALTVAVREATGESP